MSWAHQGSGCDFVSDSHEKLVMDIMVVYLPPNFGMLLLRSWIKRLGGTLQMDLTYATIPLLGGEHRRLYREA